MELDGRTAVITGGASGIGLAMAHRFARAGSRVVIADVEEPALDAAVASLHEADAEAIGVVTDVSDLDAVRRLADAAVDAFDAVHVVCNNAGVGGTSLGTGRVGMLNLQDWKWVLDVNLWGVVHGHHVFLPLLAEQDEGHIVNTASMAGHLPGHGAYSASKWAVVGITEGLFHQLDGTGVGVSCLCPGWVRTQIAESVRNRPEWAAPNALADDEEPNEEAIARAAFIREQIDGGLDPAAVADLVHDAVVDGQFWIFTDPTMVNALRGRYDAILEVRNPSPVDLGSSLTQTN